MYIAHITFTDWCTVPPLLLQELEYCTDRRGLTRLAYDPKGWNYWKWEGHNIHYAEAGPQVRGIGGPHHRGRAGLT